MSDSSWVYLLIFMAFFLLFFIFEFIQNSSVLFVPTIASRYEVFFFSFLTYLPLFTEF